MAKKIGAIVSLSIIGILILATIIMANVDVKYNIKCATPTSVWVNYNSNDSSKERQVSDAETVVNYINNASKEKSLTALFNGTLNKKAKLVAESKNGKKLPSNSSFYVRYRYENAQKVQDNNGNEVVYDDLVFTVTDTDDIQLVKVYVIPDSANATTYTYYYELEADFSSLYDYLVESGYNI